MSSSKKQLIISVDNDDRSVLIFRDGSPRAAVSIRQDEISSVIAALDEVRRG